MTCAKILRTYLGEEFEPGRLAQAYLLVSKSPFRSSSIFFGTPPGSCLTVLFGRIRQKRLGSEKAVGQAFREIRETNLSNTNIDPKHVIVSSSRDQFLVLMVLDDLGSKTSNIAIQNIEFCITVERFTVSEIPPYQTSQK